MAHLADEEGDELRPPDRVREVPVGFGEHGWSWLLSSLTVFLMVCSCLVQLGKNTNQRPEGRIRDQTHRIRDQAQNQRPDRQKPRPDSRITPLRIRDQTGPNQRPDRAESETGQGRIRDQTGWHPKPEGRQGKPKG